MIDDNIFVQLNLSTQDPESPVLIDCTGPNGEKITHRCGYIRRETVVAIIDNPVCRTLSELKDSEGNVTREAGVYTLPECGVYLHSFKFPIKLPFPAHVVKKALNLN